MRLPPADAARENDEMVLGVRMKTYFVSNSAHGRQPLLQKNHRFSTVS